MLLLAGRRDPNEMRLDPSDEEVFCEVMSALFCFDVVESQANELLKERFGKSLLNIYKHYADISARRRHQEHATENNMKYKKLNTASTQQEKLTPEMKALQKKLKNTLGYPEFFKVST